MVLGISSQSESILQNFIEDQGITFPVLRDISAVYSLYNITGGGSPYPRDFIIDQNRIIRFADTEYDPGTMITVIESLIGEGATDGDDEKTIVPASISISRIFPNPFNSSLTISVENPHGQGVELEVYDINGRWIDSIYSGWLPAGPFQFRWNGDGYDYRTLSSGIYLITLKGENFSTSKRAIFLK